MHLRLVKVKFKRQNKIDSSDQTIQIGYKIHFIISQTKQIKYSHISSLYRANNLQRISWPRSAFLSIYLVQLSYKQQLDASVLRHEVKTDEYITK